MKADRKMSFSVWLGAIGFASVLGGCELPPHLLFEDQPSLAIRSQKALVYFYRESSFQGGALTAEIQDNGITAGELKNGTYFFEYVDAGKHRFDPKCHDFERSGLDITLNGGQIYYLRLSLVAVDLWPYKPGVAVGQVDSKVALTEMSTLEQNQ